MNKGVCVCLGPQLHVNHRLATKCVCMRARVFVGTPSCKPTIDSQLGCVCLLVCVCACLCAQRPPASGRGPAGAADLTAGRRERAGAATTYGPGRAGAANDGDGRGGDEARATKQINRN